MEVIIGAIFCVFIADTELLYCSGSVSTNAGRTLVYLLMLVSVSCSLLTNCISICISNDSETEDKTLLVAVVGTCHHGSQESFLPHRALLIKPF